MTSAQPLSQRDILLFWLPLAATWILMASEGPFLVAVIARLPEATFNLAAHGVAFALAVLVESPVIMLMSAATALVRDERSFTKLRRFGWMLNALGTALLLLALVPPVYRWLTGPLMNLPPEVADLTYGALWFYLPWPAAIGYRRFLQGVLVRAGRTRLVAYGTGIRLVAMTLAAVGGYFLLDIPGAWVGGLALSIAVTVEAMAARLMAASTIRDIRAGAWVDPTSTGREELRYREIASFYYPLALTSMIGLSVQPMLTFFMANAVSPVQSLAVFPVVHALGFFFRSMGLAYQDVAIALMGDRLERLSEVSRFGGTLGLATSAALALVAFTPLSHVWFVTISGLPPELAAFALTPTALLVPLPALSVLLSFQRATLVQTRRTRPITIASVVEVGTVALSFMLLGWGVGLGGATAAFGAFLLGRSASNVYLFKVCRNTLAAGRPAT